MGFLTPILIRNYAVDMIKDESYSQKFCEDLFRACMTREETSVSIGGYCNLVESLGCKHADEPRLIVVRGNTMVELNPYKLPNSKNEFYEKCAKFAKMESLDFLKKYKERYK